MRKDFRLYLDDTLEAIHQTMIIFDNQNSKKH